MEPRHFLDIDRLGAKVLRAILDHAKLLKAQGVGPGNLAGRLLVGKSLVMIFEKPSTRTRVSFDVAMRQLGGESIVLNHSELQLGRGETIGDTARVLSRYADVVMLRTASHDTLLEFARHAGVPVINGLTNLSHPCQIVADILTLEEACGASSGKLVAWCGDSNNVLRSWIHAAVQLDFALHICSPAALAPDTDLIDWAKQRNGRIDWFEDPLAGVAGADCVVTDTWISMGDVDSDERKALLAPYQVNDRLMAAAGEDAIFMHCLPAYRGCEVTGEVIDGPRSAVFDEAENRLHAQKAILAWCLHKDRA